MGCSSYAAISSNHSHFLQHWPVLPRYFNRFVRLERVLRLRNPVTFGELTHNFSDDRSNPIQILRIFEAIRVD